MNESVTVDKDWLSGLSRRAQKCALALILFLAGCLLGTAQSNVVPADYPPSLDCPWQITSFAAAAGVSQQRVFDIAFETNGTVWLATSDGLRRYDGFLWERFGTNVGLPSAFERTVIITQKGELWVGSDAGVGIFDYATRRFTPRFSAQLPTNANVRHMAEDPDQTLWFCCDQWPEPLTASAGLVRFRNGQWRAYGTNDGLASDYIINYFRSSAGRQYAMTLSGTSILDGDRWIPSDEKQPASAPRRLIMAETKSHELFCQREGSVWRFGKGEWVQLAQDGVLVGTTRDGAAICVHRDPTKTSIWISLWDGQQFVRASSPFPCRPDARLYRVLQAPDGAIWCVGQNTLIRWDGSSGKWQLHRTLPPPRLTDSFGRVWFAETSNVVFRTGSSFYRVPALADLTTVDDQNRAWGPSASDGGLITVSLAGQTIEPVPTHVSHARSDLSDAHGVLWIIGTNPGNQPVISHREANQWRVMPVPELKNRTATGVSPDNDGAFWMVTQTPGTVDYHLAHVTEKGVEWPTLKPTQPSVIYPNFAIAAGYQWLAGYKSLYRRPLQTNRWEKMQFADARLADMVALGDEILFTVGGKEGANPACALFHDNQWQTATGVFTGADKGHDQKTLFLLGRAEIDIRRTPETLALDHVPLPYDVFPTRVVQDDDGTLWLSTSDGVLHYRPQKDRFPLPIVTTAPDARVGTELHVSFGGSNYCEIASRQNAFRYSWQFDNQRWSEFQNWPGDTIPVRGLSTGHHKLQLRVMNGDGNISAAPALACFDVVQTPLQERPWFTPLVTTVFTLIAFLIWLGAIRTRQIHSANAALRQEVAIRSQTEGELHQAHALLEQRIAERTAELSDTNKNLSREISERKQAEAMRSNLEEQLRHVHKMQAIGTMAGGIAHDFNNILGAIIPYTHLALEQTTDKPEVQDDLKQVLMSAERARILVQQILTFSGQQRQDRKPIHLGQIVNEGLQFLRSVLPRNIDIAKSIEPNLPQVLADANHMHQLLVNLCTNASHAIGDRAGQIEVRLATVKIEGESLDDNPALELGTHVRLTVRDNGGGMSPEVQERAFEPFFTTKPCGQGSGMGLAVVHGIVTDHGGTIRLQSEVGKGTRVEVYLPACTQSSSPVPSTPAHRGNNERIMLVDDEPALCSVLGHLINHLGYQVSTFTNPLAALDHIRLHPSEVDLLFTDLNMVEMSGIELAAKVRELQPELPIILATGYNHEIDRETAQIAGITTIIAKPIEPNALRQGLSQALKKA